MLLLLKGEDVAPQCGATQGLAEALSKHFSRHRIHITRHRLCNTMQVLQKAHRMADFRMASSRVGAEGGTALAQGLAAGQHPCWRTLQSTLPCTGILLCMQLLQQMVLCKVTPVMSF